MLLRFPNLIFTLACCAIFFSGCDTPQPAAQKPKQESIIGQTTQDIGEYDPNGDAEIADLQVDANASPLGAITGGYKAAVGKTSEFAIQRALLMYEIENEKYPSYDEFMADIVKAKNIQLPVLPGKRRYQYDVANHKLVIVEAAKETETETETSTE